MICTLFFYAGITGLSELLGLKDYKSIVMPLAPTILVMSGLFSGFYISGKLDWNCLDSVYYYSWFILPVLLLLVFFIKNFYVTIVLINIYKNM